VEYSLLPREKVETTNDKKTDEGTHRKNSLTYN